MSNFAQSAYHVLNQSSKFCQKPVYY